MYRYRKNYLERNIYSIKYLSNIINPDRAGLNLEVSTEQLGRVILFSSLVHLSTLMYHQQQSKWYPKDVYLSISKLNSILAVSNLLAHDNLWLCYYGQVNSLR